MVEIKNYVNRWELCKVKKKLWMKRKDKIKFSFKGKRLLFYFYKYF